MTKEVKALKKKIDKASLYGYFHGYTMTITDETVDELKIPFLQIIYDMHAFSCMEDDIWELVSLENFKSFVVSRVAIMEEQGWYVTSDKEIIYPQVKTIFTKKEKSVEKWDKIFYIRFCPSFSRVYERYDAELYWINPMNFQELVRVYLMNVIVKYYKTILGKYDVSVLAVNWVWALNNCLYPIKNITTRMISDRDKYLVGNLEGRLSEEVPFLSDIYKEYDEKKIKQLFDIPEKIMPSRGMLRHVDRNGQYINVIAGRRTTTDIPSDYNNTIYMFGGCVFFGYAEEDKNTIPSNLQRIINEKNAKYRVVNLAAWGGNIDEEHMWLRTLRYKPGDIVLISYAGIIPLGDDYEKSDISYEFAINDNRIRYFNTLVHCNRYGYEAVARTIYSKIESLMRKNYIACGYIDAFKNSGIDYELVCEFNEYYKSVENQVPKNIEKFAAIVMNCNPFTNGHRYLIEEAAKTEEWLLVFVVEEDKSEYKFEDRIKLVKEGVSDLSNVSVIRSGKMMISGKTFPEYFTKKENNTIEIDPSSDVYLFARLIAPMFHIYRRYVGEEPKDLVTQKYNMVMKEILPTYGIELIEIQRKKIDDETISASDVRRYVSEGEWEKVRQIVPITTYDYLKKHK
ncbi:adenylyltransferase/cytidyltransferase family protein [Butyrivibrio sp. LB2008]|uniref:adenylyltransferase/cytidyltransferase family protein n=1 Tax=Butyrivibrio sp. LB2008 TaxID=1408305 RepID=UPI0018CC6A45|nr:adenylyltransferase/cytidyltransferase family protein [Butyrivibrio sp. LB2008]